MGRQVFGTNMVFRETFLQIQPASSSAPYPQESNPWSSNVSEHISPHAIGESPIPVQDQRCPSGPSAKYSVIISEGEFFKESWSRPTTTADFGSSFLQLPHTSHVCLLEVKIQDPKYVFVHHFYGSNAMDQRSGVG